MIEKDNDLFVFESTGRCFTASMDGISVTVDGKVRYGYDGYVELIGEDGYADYELEFTDEEKKELALYMINKWSNWGGLSNGSYGQLIGAGGIIEVRPLSLAEMLNSSTSVEHLPFCPACANEM